MKRCICLLVSAILALIPAVPAAGHHYIYGAEDPTKQNPDSPLIDNFVLAWWWWGWNTVWWADSSVDATFVQDVRTAINNWKDSTTGISNLGWFEIGDPNLADVKFYYSSSLPCGGTGVIACVDDIDWENRLPPNGSENASYWKKINVYIKIVSWQSEDVRRTAIAHEIGHLYGLHEQYVDLDTKMCNPDVVTVMDGFTPDPQTQIISACSPVQGPQAIDVARVKNYWGGWPSTIPENLKRSEPISSAIGQGTWIITPWVDFAWAEQVHQMDWYWSSTSSGPFNNWYRGETVATDIGVHFYTSPRTLRRDINRLNYPSVPANSWSILCGKTWSVPFQRWSNTRCSNAVQLN